MAASKGNKLNSQLRVESVELSVTLRSQSRSSRTIANARVEDVQALGKGLSTYSAAITTRAFSAISTVSAINPSSLLPYDTRIYPRESTSATYDTICMSTARHSKSAAVPIAPVSPPGYLGGMQPASLEEEIQPP